MSTEKFDWKATISLNILKLKAVGLWPKGDESYKPDLYAVWTSISVVCFIFAHNFFQLVNIMFILDDLQAVTATIFLNLSTSLGLLKSYYIIQNMGILKELMVTLSSDMFQPKNDRQRKLVEPSLTFWRIIYILYWGMSLGAIFFWATFPILDKSIKDHRLPFMAWYPFDTTTSPTYELTYIYQIVSVVFVATATLSADTLIAALNMYTGSQLDILCDDLRHLVCAADFNGNFLSCVRHHKEILRFAANANKFFDMIVFLQFFISATSIGITMFQLTVVRSSTIQSLLHVVLLNIFKVAPLSSEFFSILAFEIAIVVEIFMYCWFGNQVEEKSSKIPYAIFESDWTGVPPEVRKNMIFFITRCHKPIKVSALNLFDLTLEIFMKILRTSWSYFALLHQVASSR